MFFAYRVTSGQESIVADLLYEKIKKLKLPIDALMMSTHLKGYIIAEAPNEAEAKRVIMNVPHVKGMLKSTMKIEDISQMLESKPVEVVLNKGDLVEITSGPFKGERAKVVRIEQEKDKITVELVEIAVPIPVTIKINAIKLMPR